MQTKPFRDPGPPGAEPLCHWASSARPDDPSPIDPLSIDPDAAGAGGLDPGEAGARPRPGVDDAQLARWIEQVADHDERAFTALYDATLARVYGLALRIVRNAGVAEEVVEETYFQAWRLAPRFDPARGRALAWLLAMARSRAIDAVRREARFAAESLDVEGAPLPEDPDQRAAEDLLADARGHALLRETLLELGAESRQLLALAFYRGLTHEEIAEQSALPLGTVKSQIRRALIALRRLMDSAGPPPLTT